MLVSSMATSAVVDTGLPIAVGAILGGVGSLVFIMRSHAFDEEEKGGQTQVRRSAVRRVLVIYSAIALLCLVVAIALGDVAFVVTTGAMLLLAIIGLVFFWSRPHGW